MIGTLKETDKIYLMKDGQIIEEGNFDHFNSNETSYI